MQISYNPLAQQELIDAVNYYNDKASGLGDDFYSCYQASLDLIVESPEIYQVVRQKYQIRRSLVRRFHYAIYYRINNDTIEIHAVAHQARKPNYWQNRM